MFRTWRMEILYVLIRLGVTLTDGLVPNEVDTTVCDRNKFIN